MHIAVAGGGIAGLAAALALARAGHAITLAERQAAFAETGAGIQLGPNGVRALTALGVAEAVEAMAVRPKRLRVWSGASGRLLAEAPLGTAIEARFGAPWLTVLRADLHAALLAAARAVGVTLLAGHTLEGYRPCEAGLECRLSPGPDISADALLGADGIRSVVRAALLADGPPSACRHVIYRALAPAAAVPPWAAEPAVGLWLLPGAHVVHYPVSGGEQVNIVAMADGDRGGEGWSAPAAPAEVAAHFASPAAPLADILASPSSWLKWAGCDRPPTHRWSAGRVCLIGDAAHPVLPCLAQGAVMALEDAVALARLLPRGAGDPTEAFAAFARERQPRTARLWRESRRQAAIYHLGGPLRLARDLALAGLLSGPRLVERSAWLYDWRP
jgi:salicylate hydroxylase